MHKFCWEKFRDGDFPFECHSCSGLEELLEKKSSEKYSKQTNRNCLQVCTSSFGNIWRTETLDLLNNLLRKSKPLLQHLIKKINRNFPGAMVSDEESENIEFVIDIPYVLLKFVHLVGIVLSPSAVNEISKTVSPSSDSVSLESTSKREHEFQLYQLSTVDIVDFVPKIHYPTILDFYSGLALLQQVQGKI